MTDALRLPAARLAACAHLQSIPPTASAPHLLSFATRAQAPEACQAATPPSSSASPRRLASCTGRRQRPLQSVRAAPAAAASHGVSRCCCPHLACLDHLVPCRGVAAARASAAERTVNACPRLVSLPHYCYPSERQQLTHQPTTDSRAYCHIISSRSLTAISSTRTTDCAASTLFRRRVRPSVPLSPSLCPSVSRSRPPGKQARFCRRWSCMTPAVCGCTPASRRPS